MDNITSTIVDLCNLEPTAETLYTIAFLASEQAENIRLKEERAWLKERIEQEDARLAHA